MGIGFCYLALGVIGKDAFACRTGFCCSDGAGNGLLKHLQVLSVCLPDQIANLLSVVGAVVGHGQQNTLDFQLGVDLPPDLLDGLQKLFQTFCGKVLCLHRNQGSVCHRQCVDGEHPQRGHTVQQNKIVLPFGTVQHLLEHLFLVHAVHQRHFQPCQFDVGRD